MIATLDQEALDQETLETLMTQTSQPDRPAILVFPPLVPLGVLLLGLLLQWLLPLGLLAQIAPLPRHIVGVLAFAAGMALVIVANRHFQSIGTNTRPTLPATALATGGIFAHLRNPMYVGGCLALFGIALGFALDWVLLLELASLPLIHYGIVLQEELYLETKFGEPYRRYKASVPRYGWKW
jgi:protein-S-isoprenylcysteine O-methyltransferase Ste14